jgi:hypothetical protein
VPPEIQLYEKDHLPWEKEYYNMVNPDYIGVIYGSDITFSNAWEGDTCNINIARWDIACLYH